MERGKVRSTAGDRRRKGAHDRVLSGEAIAASSLAPPRLRAPALLPALLMAGMDFVAAARRPSLVAYQRIVWVQEVEDQEPFKSTKASAKCPPCRITTIAT